MLIWLNYITGLRVSELLSLRRDNFGGDGSAVRVLGKGSKKRIVPLPQSAQEAVSSFLLSVSNGDLLFPLSRNHIGRR